MSLVRFLLLTIILGSVVGCGSQPSTVTRPPESDRTLFEQEEEQIRQEQAAKPEGY